MESQLGEGKRKGTLLQQSLTAVRLQNHLTRTRGLCWYKAVINLMCFISKFFIFIYPTCLPLVRISSGSLRGSKERNKTNRES